MAKDPVFNEPHFRCEACGATDNKGVYAICVLDYPTKPDSEVKVVYIGSSVHIKRRINNHTHVYRRLFNVAKNYVVSCFYYECDDIIQYESSLIRKYQPRFNIRLNG